LLKPNPNALQNLNPIITSDPVFVREIKGQYNAKLYTVGSGDEQIYIVHLWGTPYQMGYAHGLLVKDRMIGLVETFWAYMEKEIVKI